MVLFKETTGQLPKKIQDAYDSKKVVLKGNKSGWMTTELLKEWIAKAWVPNIAKDTSYLLVWDSFSVHKNEEVIEDLLINRNTEIAVIPWGCTSILQPLDVGINKPFKDKVRQDFQDWSISKLTDTSGTFYLSIH